MLTYTQLVKSPTALRLSLRPMLSRHKYALYEDIHDPLPLTTFHSHMISWLLPSSQAGSHLYQLNFADQNELQRLEAVRM